ncbi:MAG: DUF1367 family protein [Gammaproteobacteria bacterium]|nr:DUF1367 family protein [Gammaproteobacteria bacterium]
MNKYAFFQHRNGCLIPADDEAVTLVGKIAKANKGVLVNLYVPRNPRHHRLFFALMNEVIKAGGWEGSQNTLVQWVKIATGHVEIFVDPNGKAAYVGKSISFGSMSQAEFTPFFEAAIKAVCDTLLHGADQDELRKRILQQVDGGYSALERQR